MKFKLICAVLALTPLFWLSGCSEDKAPAPAAEAKVEAPSTAPAALPAVGVIKEIVDGDGNSYVLVELDSKQWWVAAPQMALNIGEAVAFKDPVEKLDYKSVELDRTFDKIYFVSSMVPRGAMTMENVHGDTPPQQPMAHPATVIEDTEIGNIEKVEGGVTVEETFTKTAELAGKEVSIRAKVVKFSGGIMGTNWLHVRDGSGAQGTNDLTITSNDIAAVGDIVVVKGILSKDIDIGSGYQFPVIIQDAKLTKE